jgi:beta-fructofuranosidase
VSDDDLLMATYALREKMVADAHRPRYHFCPPEGRWNDVNGMIYWKGRYHAGYLQKIRNGPGQLDFSSQQHISSRDLVHWRYHPAALREPLEGAKGDYFNSGDVMEGTEVPTIITNMPRRGICIYQAFDDDLDHWVPLAGNPVIPVDAEGSRASARFPECVIFDPSGWQEGDTYYALIGNKNHRPGYEGDSTSLFKSKDLVNWAYVGPFYKSDRKWTAEVEDCACSDFFPFGDQHMLLMHTHQPYSKCQYYIGRYENDQFYPERNGQLSWLGSMLAGPETLIDDKGRRIFLGWIRDARDWESTGWTGVMTLPVHFYPGPDNGLKIAPVRELEVLRYDETQVGDLTLRQGEEVTLDALCSDCMEVKLTLSPDGATEYGLKLRCSPDGEEETTVVYDARERQFVIDFSRSSTDKSLAYPQNTTRQIVPYSCDGGDLALDIYVDRSVIEIFVNSDVVLVQRVYPTRDDSRQSKVFSRDGALTVTDTVKWEMDASNPW